MKLIVLKKGLIIGGKLVVVNEEFMVDQFYVVGLIKDGKVKKVVGGVLVKVIINKKVK